MGEAKRRKQLLGDRYGKSVNQTQDILSKCREMSLMLGLEYPNLFDVDSLNSIKHQFMLQRFDYSDKQKAFFQILIEMLKQDRLSDLNDCVNAGNGIKSLAEDSFGYLLLNFKDKKIPEEMVNYIFLALRLSDKDMISSEESPLDVVAFYHLLNYASFEVFDSLRKYRLSWHSMDCLRLAKAFMQAIQINVASAVQLLDSTSSIDTDTQFKLQMLGSLVNQWDDTLHIEWYLRNSEYVVYKDNYLGLFHYYDTEEETGEVAVSIYDEGNDYWTFQKSQNSPTVPLSSLKALKRSVSKIKGLPRVGCVRTQSGKRIAEFIGMKPDGMTEDGQRYRYVLR